MANRGINNYSQNALAILKDLGFTITKAEKDEILNQHSKNDVDMVFIRIRNKYWLKEGFRL